MEPIRLFVTGGTFDKEYDELTGRLFFKETHLPEMLRLGRCGVKVDIDSLMLLDSLDMTDDDRRLLLDNCRSVSERRIVITHGTDTMEQTARLIGAAGLEKTIVLTGAMVPYAFGSSDGLFNLGAALAFAQSLPMGTFIAMNGRHFNWDNVHKDRATGLFKERQTS